MMHSPRVLCNVDQNRSKSPTVTPKKDLKGGWCRNKIKYVDKNLQTVLKVGMPVYAYIGKVWREAVVTDVSTMPAVRLCLVGGEEHFNVDVSDLSIRNSMCDFLNIADLTQLSPISPAAVLECLKVRYQNKSLYTKAGSTLVAVNPFCDYSSLYSHDVILCYNVNESCDDLAVHIYTVAQASYRQLKIHSVNQSVIVSGESGAGKTVSAKHLMKYFVTVANSSTVHSANAGDHIEQKILVSNPILEAFGNASTLRNKNSSRFGKYIQLYFDKSHQVEGATILTYLLEKTRVVHQTLGECNFHVFYLLIHGWNEIEKYINVKDQYTTLLPNLSNRNKNDDQSSWLGLTEALSEIGLNEEQQQHIFILLVTILHLLNLNFNGEEDDLTYIDTDNPGVAASIEMASYLLGVEQNALELSFTHRKITASHSRRKSIFHKPCNIVEAQSRRDCLAKILYAKLFDWLVVEINHSINTPSPSSLIGILDIYGFESFASNSLEQLCINYANERLQQHFVIHFLKDLQEEYVAEAIPWQFTDFADNRPCLEVLEGQLGLFDILNEECAMKRPSNNDALCDRILTEFSSHSHFGRSRHAGFVIHHYAQPVEYDIEGLLEKNKDDIPSELLTLLNGSSNQFVCNLFQDMEQELPGRKKKTVLAKFKSSLDQLMQTIECTEPHYIRCLKANSKSQPMNFDSQYILDQLDACGIVETVNISKQGYAAKMTYHEFQSQYSLILRQGSADATQFGSAKENNTFFMEPQELLLQKQMLMTQSSRKSVNPKKKLRRRAESGDHTRKLCSTILRLVFGQSSNAQFGCTKIFLKEGQLEKLESERAMILEKCAISIQSAWRAYKVRTEMKKAKAVIVIQSVTRGWIQKCQMKRKIDAIKTLQKFARKILKNKYKRMLNSTNESNSTTDESHDSKTVSSLPIDMIQYGHCLNKYLSPKIVIPQGRETSNTSNVSLSCLPDVLPLNLPDVANHVSHLQETSIVQCKDSLKNSFSKVANEILHTFISGNRFQLIGAYQGIPYLEAQNGMISRRRMPRVKIRFHTKANQVIRYGHHIHRREFECSLTDCL